MPSKLNDKSTRRRSVDVESFVYSSKKVQPSIVVGDGQLLEIHQVPSQYVHIPYTYKYIEKNSSSSIPSSLSQALRRVRLRKRPNGYHRLPPRNLDSKLHRICRRSRRVDYSRRTSRYYQDAHTEREFRAKRPWMGRREGFVEE